MDRRSFLGLVGGAGLVTLAGCTDSRPRPVPTGTSTATSLPDDDDGLRDATFAAEQQLVTLYASALATASPQLVAQLRAVQDQHVQHAQRLRPELTVSTEPPSPSPSGTAPPTLDPAQQSEQDTASASPPEVSVGPGETGGPAGAQAAAPRPQAVLANLRRAELAAVRQRSAACEQAEDPQLARSLCLIAASEAQHADVLSDLRAELE